MHTSAFLVLTLLGAPALSHPGQSPVDKRTVTPDNTCGNVAAGNNHGYTCDPNNAYGGPCCSQAGYCGLWFSLYGFQAKADSWQGTTSAYCGTGCQSGFGTCGNSASPAPIKSGCVWQVTNTGSFTQQQSFDFSTNTFPTSGLAISTDTIGAGSAPYSQLYTKANVNVAGGSLQLTVPGGQHASPILGAEVYTTVNDILYASVRTRVQVSNVGGTCHGTPSFLNLLTFFNQRSDPHIYS